MNFAEKLNLTDAMTHEEKYNAIVDAIGYENVKLCVPYDIDTLIKAYKRDIHFNTLSMKRWDNASGFICKGKDVIPIPSPLKHFIFRLGVNCYSNAQGVCILKQCARRMVEEAVA